MTLSRWKLMAGVLGLSMCGLAALAEPACRSVGLTRRAEDTQPVDPEKPTDAGKPVPLPVPATPPADTAVPPPVIPPVDDKKADALPPPIPVEVKPVPMPAKNDPKAPPAFDPKLLEEVAKTQNPPVPLPTLKEEKKGDALPPIPGPTPVPLPSPPQPNPVPPVAEPAPVPAPPVTQPIVRVKDEKPALPPEGKVVDPLVPAKPDPAAEAVKGLPNGKKLKVTLHLSDDKPWFEVKDGDDLVLKVTADGVNLTAAADGKKAAAGTLTAVGGVTFRTLGGYGTCDELQVVPGTGEVVVNGKVSVTSNWGKSETTATADKMTFRLGNDAGKK